MIIGVRVSPRASKPGIGEWGKDSGGRSYLNVRVAAAPADGAANRELIKLLSKTVGVSNSSVRIVGGETSRLKRVEVPFEETEMRARLSR